MKRFYAFYLIPIYLYQKILSPLKPATCRFTPTCSHYFIEAVMKKGILKGTFMGLWRILRCHPFHAGGDDPVR